MRNLLFVLFAAISMLLASCGNKPDLQSVESPVSQVQPSEQANESSDNDQPGFVGYVVNKEDNRILVVNNEERDFSANGGASHYYEAIWFSKADSDIEIGQQVEVWTDSGINDSYPGQGRADRIRVIESVHPEGALLQEAEAIRKALQSPDSAQYEIPVVKEVRYDAKSSQWHVTMTGNGEESRTEIAIADQSSGDTGTE